MTDLELGAELTAIKFIMENLFAMFADKTGTTADEIDDLADELCRQITLPATRYGPGDLDMAELQELASHRVSMFMARVKERLASAE